MARASGIVLGGHTDGVTDVAFSPDGRYVVTASRDATARIWDTRTGRLLSLARTGSAIDRVMFSPRVRRLAATPAI